MVTLRKGELFGKNQITVAQLEWNHGVIGPVFFDKATGRLVIDHGCTQWEIYSDHERLALLAALEDFPLCDDIGQFRERICQVDRHFCGVTVLPVDGGYQMKVGGVYELNSTRRPVRHLVDGWNMLAHRVVELGMDGTMAYTAFRKLVEAGCPMPNIDEMMGNDRCYPIAVGTVDLYCSSWVC